MNAGTVPRGTVPLVCTECGRDFTGRKIRPNGRTVCRRCLFSGGRNPRYRGGLSFDAGMRRWRICCRDGTFVWYARAVLEAELRRPLRSDEQVHHMNGDTTDDQVHNLQILDPVTHGRIHGYQSGYVRRARAAEAA